MKVICDQNLLIEPSQLPSSTELIKIDGRRIKASDVQDTDVLLVRSVTRVDESLLEGSSVKFVGTATSGTDHLDINYLNRSNIEWHSAPGSNADAVTDYCIACIGLWGSQIGRVISDLRVGIIGAGQVGSRLARRLSSFGLQVYVCDPPQVEDGNAIPELTYVDLDKISECEIVSLHVPFTREGECSTENLINSQFLDSLPEQSLLINSCRGEVVNEPALLLALNNNPGLSVALDVWLGEPQVNSSLASKALIATPHIAGYSQLAKLSAAQIISDRLLEFINSDMPQRSSIEDLKLYPIETNGDVWEAVKVAFDVESISNEFKLEVSKGLSEKAFDLMRKQIANRKEFRELVVDGSGFNEEGPGALKALGIGIA